MLRAVELGLHPVFASDLHSAGRARKESAICLWFIFLFVSRTTSSFHHFLHKVPKFLCHYWLVLTFVYFAIVSEVSVVERIGEDKGRAGNVDSLSIFCNEVVALKIFSDTLQCLVAFRVQLKRVANNRRGLFVHDNRFRSRVVDISHGGKTWIFAAPHFLAQPSFCIFGKRIHIIFALPESHIQHELSLRSAIAPKSRKLQARKFFCIEEINYSSTINTISCETIRMPSENISADFFNLV